MHVIEHSAVQLFVYLIYFFTVHTDMTYVFGTHMDRHRPNISGVPDESNVCIFCCSASRNHNKAQHLLTLKPLSGMPN